MELKEAVKILKKGYCLWVGAGVSKHLAANVDMPTWGTLVDKLEKQVKISHPENLNLDCPERLKIVFDQMGRYKFAVAIKELILQELALSILKNFDDNMKNSLPVEFKQIAALGRLANPIVNFNVETLSSTALAGIHDEDYCLKVFKIPDIDDNLGAESIEKDVESHKRHVFHPHGAIDSYGRCILTTNEYSSLYGTLAYQLSTHAAFHSNLVIVGMSLQDKYLRYQLSQFRQQIGKILWFMTNAEYVALDKLILKETIINNFDIIRFENWMAFWEHIYGELKNPNEKKLIGSYESLLNRSLAAKGYGWKQLFNLLIDQRTTGEVSLTEDKRKEMNYYLHRAPYVTSAYHRGETLPSDEELSQSEEMKNKIDKYFKNPEFMMTDP